MSYYGEKASEALDKICEIVEGSARTLGRSSEIEAHKNEVFAVVFSLISKIFAADGVLRAGESEFLNDILYRDYSVEENVKLVDDWLAEWNNTITSIPPFFTMVVLVDLKNGTNNANQITEEIQQIGLYASLSDEGSSEDKEQNFIQDYITHLQRFAENPNSGSEEVGILDGSRGALLKGPEALEHQEEKSSKSLEVREEHFGNARDVRNLFEHTISKHANRAAQLSTPSDEDLRTILVDDLPAGTSFPK